MELMHFGGLYTPGDDWTSMQCEIKKECDKMSIVYDYKDNHKVGGKNPLAVLRHVLSRYGEKER